MQPATMIYTPTVERHPEPLTENGFTVAEEREILNIIERMRKGEEKIYSSEEAWKLLGLDD